MTTNELDALRAIGCTDDEIRRRATDLGRPDSESAIVRITAHLHTALDHKGTLGGAAYWRTCLAFLRAAEQLGPERTPVTLETPLGTGIANPDETFGSTLVGWTRDGRLVYERPSGLVYADAVDGWYVVEGDR